jgi:hypothetical protein
MNTVNVRQDVVRPIALAVFFATLGLFLRLLLSILFDIEMSRLVASLLNFALAALSAFVIFPNVIKRPFGGVPLSEYLRRLGFYLPSNVWRHVALGVVLAVCTLGSMLIGSLLTGRYAVDWSTITLGQTIFSLNAGVWEEFFYRGIIMLVLLLAVKSVRKAALIQIALFALLHIKGFDISVGIDVLTVAVIAIAFTYTAFKTRTLVAGIVFHFVHDALLFFVQVPSGERTGVAENLAFYGALWIGVAVACLITKLAAEKLGVHAAEELYAT